MKELLESIIRMLVEDPDSVKVEEIEEERNILLKVSVAPNDMGKVIGKDGRIAKSVRQIIRSASKNSEKPVYIDIV